MASAKQIRDEIMKMTIIVNSDPAQNEIRELSKANTEFRKEVEKLTQKKKELGKETEDNKKQHKELADEIKKLNSTIYSNNEKIEELRGGMDITRMTMGQLRKEAQLLRLQLRDVIPGSDAAKLLESQLSKVNTRIGDVEKSARNTQSSFQQLSSKFQQYSGIITAVAAVLIGFGLSVQNIIDRNNKMADAMSQVEKNANMTRQEVEALTRSFSDMDTRTKKIDLLKIATAGGRLGVAKEDIKDFVVEIDKANVALGDSWEGGADKIAEEIGRIALSYQETKNQPIAQSINEIGSALNELAADGTSSESNIADFMNRLGSLPPSMKPPITTLLGLGAALEESSIKAEIGSSGISKFFRVAGTNVEAFADVMQRPVQEIKDLINSNPAEFFIQFSEGLKAYNATDVTQILDKLKLNDNEVQRVIGAATDKSERFRQIIEKSNQAFKEHTSLQQEFDKMNNNSAAIYEKVQRKIAELFTSQTFANYLNTIITLLGKFLGVVKDTDGYVTAWRNNLILLIKVLAIIMVSTISYNLLLGTYNLLLDTAAKRIAGLTLVQKASNGITSLSNTLQNIYNTLLGHAQLKLGLLIKSTELQTAAQERLNLVTKANPWGAILSVIIAVATTYYMFRQETEKIVTTQKELNDVLAEGKKQAASELSALEQSYKKLTNKNIAEKERIKILDELKQKYPNYFGNLTLEDFLVGKATKSYKELKDAIIASSRARALEGKIGEFTSNELDIENSINDVNGKIAEIKKKLSSVSYAPTMIKDGINPEVDKLNSMLELARIRREELKAQLLNLQSRKNFFINQKGLQEKNSSGLVTETPGVSNPPYKVPDESSDKASKDAEKSTNKAESEHKKLMEDYKRRADEAGKLSVELEKEINEKKIEAMEDGFAKELALIDEQQRQKLAELEKKKITPEEIKKLQEIEAKATGTDKEFFKTLLNQWKANNQEVENAKNAEIKYFADKRGALINKNAIEEEKRSYDLFKKELEVLNREKNEKIGTLTTVQDQINFLREKGYTENLDKIKTWEEGAATIEKYYQAQSLKRQLEFLKTKVDAFNAMVAMGDATLMTPENLKTIEDYKNKIAELQAEIAKLLNKKPGEDGKKVNAGKKNDILGLSQEEWKVLFDNIQSGKIGLESWIGAIEAVKNAFDSYYQFVQAKEQAQVRQVEVAAKRKEKSLKRQLDSGLISQEEYETGIQKLNNETEQKKWELEVQAAKRQRLFQTAQIVANTAQAIMSIYSTGGGAHYTDFGASAHILAAIVAGIGAMQLATVLATPLPEAPGYEQGFGMEENVIRQQDGKRFRAVRRRLTSGLVDRPTHFIAGENGVEMVIDSPTYTKFPESVKRTINQQIAIAKGYEGGRYPYLSEKNNSSAKDDLMMELLIENREAIRELRNTKFTAVVDKNDMRSAKNMIEMQEDFNYYKNK